MSSPAVGFTSVVCVTGHREDEPATEPASRRPHRYESRAELRHPEAEGQVDDGQLCRLHGEQTTSRGEPS